MATWADLRALRDQGLKPSLPVVITVDGKRPAWVLETLGCLVIKHEPGEVFHAELLDGLRVWLFLGNCDRAQSVVKAMKAKSVQPAQLSAWCPCRQALESSPVGCVISQAWAA